MTWSRDDWEAEYASDEPAVAGPDGFVVARASELLPGRALEIGCGTGGTAIWLAEHGWWVTAIDIAGAAIEKAKAAATEAGVEVDFVRVDATTYQPTDEYDLVVSTYALPGPGEPTRLVLGNATGALAPGGVLVLTEWDASSPGVQGWGEGAFMTLDEIVEHLGGLDIERAELVEPDPTATEGELSLSGQERTHHLGNEHGEAEGHEHEGVDADSRRMLAAVVVAKRAQGRSATPEGSL